MYLFSWKIAPALVAGNTVIAKPSEITPYTASKLAEVCIEVGFPKGVLNILNGFGHTVGEDIVKEKILKQFLLLVVRKLEKKYIKTLRVQ